MGRWAKHEGARSHISLKRSVEMLELQCAQRFPASPANPASSVFAEFFPAPSPAPSQPNVPTEKAKQMHLNWNPLGFLSDLSAHKILTRFPPDVWQAFFCRSLGAPIPKMLAHARSRTLCSCKMGIDPLGDHVLTCKQHTGAIRGHNHLMDVVANLARASKIGAVKVNHRVSTTGDGTRKQGDVEISNFPISLRDGLVTDVSFVCEFKGSSRAPGGWNNGVRHTTDVLQARANLKTNKYKEAYALVHKAFAPAIVGMSGQIHVDFLRLLWILADNQMQSYYGSIGKEDKIGSEAYRWAKAKVFNSNKTSVGRAIAFGCATRCHLSVHSLAMPRSGSDDASRGRQKILDIPGHGENPRHS